MILRPEPQFIGDLPKSDSHASGAVAGSAATFLLMDYWFTAQPGPPKTPAGWAVAIAATVLLFVFSFATLGLGLLAGIFWFWTRMKTRRSRLRMLAVEDDHLSCWVAENLPQGQLQAKLSAGTLPVWQLWRVPLAEVQRIEIGSASPYIPYVSKAGSEGVLDVFFMAQGQRHVVGRFDNLVENAVEEFRHSAWDFVVTTRTKIAEAHHASTDDGSGPETVTPRRRKGVLS